MFESTKTTNLVANYYWFSGIKHPFKYLFVNSWSQFDIGVNIQINMQKAKFLGRL
jgi:hypothetical protein